MRDAKTDQSGADRVLYTPEEVAEMTGLSRGWLVEKARAGEIPHWKGPKFYRFSPSDVEEIRQKYAQSARPPS